MVNDALIIGRAGADAEVRNTANGKQVVRASLATDHWKGQGQKDTTWHRIVGFGYSAEHLAPVRKGDLVYVRGRISVNEYTDREGNKRTSFEIVADKVKVLQQANPAPAANGSAPAEEYSDYGNEDDGLPF